MTGMPAPESASTTYTAFAGAARVGAGELATLLPVIKARFDADPSETVLVFEDQTGRQVDFDLRGPLEQVIERALPRRKQAGPGRPRLGVTSREVSLLPAHWDWLEAQPAGISGTLRRLVEEARRREPGKQRARAAREAAGRVMTALGGDRANFEEASRALYARDHARVLGLIRTWPPDIRAHLGHMLRIVDELEPRAG